VKVSNYQITKLPDYQITNATDYRGYEGFNMQLFHVRYRNAQGTLMRILNAVSRRGLDLTSVHAEYAGQNYVVTLLLEVTPKQIGQLHREWYGIVDVIEVRTHEARSSETRSSAALAEQAEAAWEPHPQASASVAEQSARAALA
jgi:acetolactate synthase regulatory subunit